MDRRGFMKKACEAGAGGIVILAAAGKVLAQSETESAAEAAALAAREACEKDRKFSQGWIVRAVERMDGTLGEKSRTALLEE